MSAALHNVSIKHKRSKINQLEQDGDSEGGAGRDDDVRAAPAVAENRYLLKPELIKVHLLILSHVYEHLFHIWLLVAPLNILTEDAFSVRLV